jgi:hypothetical protein
MGTADLMKLLQTKFAPPQWALLREVADGTGFSKSRWADAVAMGIWPSRGLELHGFELKVSRSDWTKELANPAKAEAVCRFCDRWWVVVGDAAIVKPGELPPTWGLMVPKGSGLGVVTDAPKLEPVPITRLFLAALMRRVHEQKADTTEVEAARRAGLEEGEKRGEQFGRNRADRDANDLKTLRERVHAFEAASGLSIERGWEGGEKIGKAVRAVLDGYDPFTGLQAIHDRLGQMLRDHEAAGTLAGQARG